MIKKLYDLKESHGSISPQEIEEINKYLAKMTVNNLPVEQLKNIEDYLVNVLNINAVSFEYRELLGALLDAIQNIK
jgi:major membrane immunogen (membrane-anchored lipoprotein)